MKTQKTVSIAARKILSVLMIIFVAASVNPSSAESPNSNSKSNQIEYGEKYLPQTAVYTELQNSPDATAYVVIRLKKPHTVAAATMAEKRIAVKAVQESVITELAADEFNPVHIYDNFAAMTGYVNEQGLAKLAANPNVLSIGLDVGGHGHLNDSVPFINADDVHSLVGLGYTGEGITVAVLDTGIDSDHPDLRDNIADGWYYFLNETSGTGAEDDEGHGTNVAGIITSKGSVAPLGVAPDADILAIKVLDDDMKFQHTSIR